MLQIEKYRFRPAWCLLGTVVAGAACTKWIPSDWFLNVLGYSILAGVILAFLSTLDLKNERHAPLPMAVVLELLWLPSRNAQIKIGPALWAFLGVAGFVTGVLVSALLLPLFA